MALEKTLLAASLLAALNRNLFREVLQNVPDPQGWGYDAVALVRGFVFYELAPVPPADAVALLTAMLAVNPINWTNLLPGVDPARVSMPFDATMRSALIAMLDGYAAVALQGLQAQITAALAQ